MPKQDPEPVKKNYTSIPSDYFSLTHEQKLACAGELTEL